MNRKTPSSELSPQNQNLFKKALTCCEKKQYKDAIKFCKKILKSYPNHSETIALMGMLLFFKGNKDEGLKKSKEGLSLDPKNSHSWRYFGIIMRELKQYDKAVSSFKSSLKADPNNFGLMRDIAMIQVHIGDYAGNMNTRFNILKQKSNLRHSWVGCAVACELSGELESAIKVITEFRRAQNESLMTPSSICSDYSEIVKYHIHLLLKSKKESSIILNEVKKSEPLILDKCFYLETLGRLYLDVDDKRNAFTTYFKLVSRNPEQSDYFLQMISSLDLSYEQKLALLIKLRGLFTKSECLKLLILQIAQGEQFLKEFHDYFEQKIQKFIPNIFELVKFLYQDSHKASMIEEIVLKQTEPNIVNGFVGTVVKDASRELAVRYFLACHYFQMGNIQAALTNCEAAITHTPTFVDACLLKATILKSMDLLADASKVAIEACQQDTADRYLNCISSKYKLLIEQTQEAQELQTIYFKDGKLVPGLKDLQVSWYMLAFSESELLHGRYESAAQYANYIYEIFSEFSEDMYDFHSYVLRKCTLTSYIDLIEYNTRIWNHSIFYTATKILIDCYLKFSNFDFWLLSNKLPHNIPAEITKYLNIAINQLTKFHPDDIETHFLAFLVYCSQEKVLLMLRELFAINRINPNDVYCLIAKITFAIKCRNAWILLEENIRKLCEEVWSESKLDLPNPAECSQEDITSMIDRFSESRSSIDILTDLYIIQSKNLVLSSVKIEDNQLDLIIDTLHKMVDLGNCSERKSPEDLTITQTEIFEKCKTVCEKLKFLSKNGNISDEFLQKFQTVFEESFSCRTLNGYSIN